MNQTSPFVSVIVPVRNAREYLVQTLAAIRNSNYPNYELIVVDDGSSDGSSEVARRFAHKVVQIDKNNALEKPRNKGVQESRGDILLFVDSDVKVAKDTISKVVDTFVTNSKIDGVFGLYDDNPPQKDSLSQYKNLLHHFTHLNACIQAKTFWTGCGAIKRDAFFAAGGFPQGYLTQSIEDVALGYRLNAMGRTVLLRKDLVVTHLKHWGFFSFLKAEILYRAIPWTFLCCEQSLPKDLNFKMADRISGAIACLLPLAIGISFFFPYAWFGTAALLTGFSRLNRKVFSFFLEKRGLRFVLFAIFFHWLYFFYSTVTFVFFTLVFRVKKFFIRKPKTSEAVLADSLAQEAKKDESKTKYPHNV